MREGRKYQGETPYTDQVMKGLKMAIEFVTVENISDLMIVAFVAWRGQ